MKEIINNARQPVTSTIGVLGVATALGLWAAGKVNATELAIVIPLCGALIFVSGDGIKFKR